jgi:small multidrug resistance pump
MLGCAIVTEVTGTLALRAGQDHPFWYALTACGYAASFFLLARMLRAGMPVGTVYGIWGASGVALTAVLGAAIFGEALGFATVLGIVLIIIGVLTIEFASQRSRASAEEDRV